MAMHPVLALPLALFVLLSTGSTAASLTNSDAPRDDGWQTATLEESGFDRVKMQQLTQRLESGWHPNAHMVLVAYQGKLVYEKYLSGDDETRGVIEEADRDFSLSACEEGITGNRLENQEWHHLAATGASGMAGYRGDICRTRGKPNDAGKPMVPGSLDAYSEPLT